MAVPVLQIRKHMKSLKDSLQKMIDTDLFKDYENKEKISADDIQSVISKLKDKEKALKCHNLHKAFVIMQTESAATR